MKNFCNAISSFSLDLYKVSTDTLNQNQNVCLSPFSLSAALMLTMLGTEGGSESQLMAALKLTEFKSENVHEEFKKLQEILHVDKHKNITLSVANRMFCKLGLNIKPEYGAKSLKFYGSELQLLDFSKEPQESTSTINSWVEKQTDDKIKDLIPSGLIDDLTLLIIANAVYFKGDWCRKFKPEETKEKDFFCSRKDVTRTDMMCVEYKKWNSGISSEFKCKVLEMPYKGDTHSMVLILPDDIDGLPELEQKLSTNLVSNLCSCLKKQRTKVEIPKFKIESSFELQKVLPRLGIVDIFDDKLANFNGTFEAPRPDAYVSHVVHKAFIEVTEKGTVAAAASAVVEKDRCIERKPPSVFKFVADHPFLFIIKENSTGTLIFIGRFNKPEKKYGRKRNSSSSSRSSVEDSFDFNRSSSSESAVYQSPVRKRAKHRDSRYRETRSHSSDRHRHREYWHHRYNRRRSPYQSRDYNDWSRYKRSSSRRYQRK